MNAPDLVNHERWHQTTHSGHEHTQNAIKPILAADLRRRILNCAQPEIVARNLTDFTLPAGLDYDQCLRAGSSGIVPACLRNWKYEPRIRAVPQLPSLQPLPTRYKALRNLPWFDCASPTRHLAINARHIRFNHDLWHELKPRMLRGVSTTLVLAMPQIGVALTPHIDLKNSFLYLGALARGLGAVQLFPARYLFPDARLGELADTPAPIFADLLPATCGYAWPVVDHEPDPWRALTRYEKSDRNFGFPFGQAINPQADVTLTNIQPGTMLLPDGTKVHARQSESLVYATLDPKLGAELKLERDAFEARTGLLRGTVTHDGLPFQLPVAMQCQVYAVIFGQWELELDQAGDLSSYTLRTKHAAIRGFNYYQRVEPFYSNFMRAVHDVTRHPDFKAYPLATHLTDSWLSGNLQISNRMTPSERDLGSDFMRAFYHQQLDWQMGTNNLMNHLAARTKREGGFLKSKSGEEIESQLDSGGLAFHQLQKHMLRFDSNQFWSPCRPASLWPNHHSGWPQLDQHLRDVTLPKL